MQITPTHIQFTYCDYIRKKTENIWKFTVFTNCFDQWTWLAIGCAFIGVSLIQFASSWVLIQNVAIQIGNIVLTTLSPLISPGVVTNTYISECPGSFTVWIFACIILTNYYTGILTSLLISPPPPDTMSKVEDLQIRNYSLIFDSPFLLDALNSTVSSHFLGSAKFHQKDITTLKTLLENVKLYDDLPKFLKALAYGPNKVATVVGWPFALYTTAKANDLLRQNMPVQKRECFVGKELVHSGNYYYGFLPPGNHLRLRDTFLKLVEAGIAELWSAEVFGLAYSPGRVQDRLRVKSPTNIVSEDNDQVHALKMQGKIVTIFLVWILCLFAAGVSFVLEKFIFGRSITKVHQIAVFLK